MLLFPVIFLVFVVLVVLFALSHQNVKARRAELSELAQRIGFRFTPEKDRTYKVRYQGIGAFRRGSDPFAYNTLRGSVYACDLTVEAVMGDYHYETHSTDSKGRQKTHTHRFSYLMFETPIPGAPALAIRPETFFDSIGAFFGADDIDFESAEFSRRFHVKSPDKRFAYDLIHPRMIEFLLRASPQTIEMGDRWCCVTHGEKLWSTDDFESTLNWSQHFLDHWPAHLIDTHAPADTTRPDA